MVEVTTCLVSQKELHIQTSILFRAAGDKLGRYPSTSKVPLTGCVNERSGTLREKQITARVSESDCLTQGLVGCLFCFPRECGLLTEAHFPICIPVHSWQPQRQEGRPRRLDRKQQPKQQPPRERTREKDGVDRHACDHWYVSPSSWRSVTEWTAWSAWICIRQRCLRVPPSV